MNNKDRIISSIGFVLTLVLPSCNAGQLNVPAFEHDPNKRIHITAYSGPTRAKLVTPTSPETLTEEHMRKVSEAGFTKILALYEGAGRQVGNDTYEIIENLSQKAQEDALIALDLAEQFGIKYYVRDWSFYGMVKQYADPTYNHPAILTDEQYDKVLKKMFDENNQYIHHPAYAGNFCHDEPFYNELDRIAVQVDLYQKYMAEQNAYGEPIVNLLPMTAGADALSGHSYYEYVDHYFDLIAPKVGFVSYDFYPFREDKDDGSYLKDLYVPNLNLMATKCKDNNIDLRTFIQAEGDFTGTRSMTGAADFRFQIYTELAFGSKEIIYYEYANAKSQADPEADYALFNTETEEYNWTYDAAKLVNNEIHQIEDAYLQYKWDGVMYKCANELIENIGFSYLKGEKYTFTSHPRVSIENCERDALMGVFKNEANDDAFMLVNYTDPYFKFNNKVTLHFNNAKGLLMYRLGQKMVVDLPSSGNYTFDLYPGEGRFIIPIN